MTTNGKSLTSLKLEGENQTLFRCSGCNGTFQKPILATVNSHGYAQTYYACPRCLAKVAEVRDSKERRDEEVSPSVGKVKRAEVKHESAVEYKHFLGYLKRPKGTSIPDSVWYVTKWLSASFIKHKYSVKVLFSSVIGACFRLGISIDL